MQLPAGWGGIFMRLVTGGSCQGKLSYVRGKMEKLLPEGESIIIADGASCTEEELYSCSVVNHFHLYIRRCMEQGEDPVKRTEDFIRKNPGAWVITDEVGCGVVPVDTFERAWREAAGRAACRIAGQSVQVYRMVCGVARCLKDENI